MDHRDPADLLREAAYDEGAREALADWVMADVTPYARRLYGSRFEEVVQETWIRVQRALERGSVFAEQNPQAFVRWHARKAFYSLVNTEGRQRRNDTLAAVTPETKPTSLHQTQGDSAPANAASASDDPAEELLGLELREKLEDARKRLPAKLAAAVAAQHVLNLSKDEAADLQGIAPGTQGSRTSRGLAQLRQDDELRVYLKSDEG